MGNEFDFSQQDLTVLLDDFREIKHGVNNSIAVVMALAELAQRNPQYNEKLTATILSRCPEIVNQLQDFQVRLAAKLPKEPGSATVG